MFHIGDLVVYKNSGVYRVEDIGTLDFTDDRTKEYYSLRALYDNGNKVIFTPVHQTGYMRKLMSEEEMTAVLQQNSDMEAAVFTPRRSMKNTDLVNHYKDILNTHDFTTYLRTLKDLAEKEEQSKKTNKRLGAIDIQYQQILLNIVSQEVAAVMDNSLDDVKGRLLQSLQTT